MKYVFATLVSIFVLMMAYGLSAINQVDEFSHYINQDIDRIGDHNLKVIQEDKGEKELPYPNVDESYYNLKHSWPWDRNFAAMVVYEKE